MSDEKEQNHIDMLFAIAHEIVPCTYCEEKPAKAVDVVKEGESVGLVPACPHCLNRLYTHIPNQTEVVQ